MILRILIPIYNEEKSIGNLLESIVRYLEESKLTYEILVVNDGSTDSSLNIIRQHSLVNSKIGFVSHEVNKGLGEAEITGFLYLANKSKIDDIIIRIEGDDTHGPQYILPIINKLNQGYDVVNTSRFQKGGGQIGLSPYRKAISYLANLFMKVILRINNVYDFSCGYRGYKASIIKDAFVIYGKDFLQLRGLGFTATLEIIIKLKLMGCTFAEVPFILRYDKKQSNSKMVSSITAFGYLVMAVLYHWPWGGWRVNYKKVRKLYKEDRSLIIKKYAKFGYSHLFKYD